MALNPSFLGLAAKFDENLKGSARFVRAAFHIHSPESYDWGKRVNADAVRNDKGLLAQELEFLRELKAAGLQVVCITDHMRASFACRLAKAAKADGGIVVFPGMEVNCIIAPSNDRVHLLVVFPPDADTTQIERIFSWHHGFAAEPTRKGSEDFILHRPLSEWKQEVENQGGLLILAHIDESSRGHRAHYRSMRHDSLKMFITDAAGLTRDDKREISQEYQSLLFDSQPHAVEIMTPEDRMHYIAFKTRDGKAGRIPCVIRSDCHCVEDFKAAEKHTFVKVSTPTFQGIADALKFCDTRIKFHTHLCASPPSKVVGIRLRSPSKKGLFEDDYIAFNENLNCVIGPRGCGKSTIVEALRYSFGLNDPRIELDRNKHDFRQIALGIQHANLRDSILEVVYESANRERFCLRAQFDEKSLFTTEVFSIDGTERKTTREGLLQEFPIRLYSWSEMEHLGREPQVQRDLLDRFVEPLVGLVNQKRQLFQKLSESRKRIEALSVQLSNKLLEEKGLLGRYVEFKADFDRANTPEVAVLFEELDTARAKVKLLEECSNSITATTTTSEEIFDAIVFSQELLKDVGEPVRAWWESVASPRIRLTEYSATLQGARSNIDLAARERVAVIEALLVTLRAEVKIKEADLREKTKSSPEDELVLGKREQTKKRFESAERLRSGYQAIWDNLHAELKAHDEVVREIEKSQNEISGSRQSSRDAIMKRLNEFKTSDLAIEITFESGKDREKGMMYMRDSGFLNQQSAGQYKNKRIAERCCFMAKPTCIARAILTRNPQLLTTEGHIFGTPETLSEAEATTLIDYYHPFGRDVGADVDTLDAKKLGQVFELQAHDSDDSVRILLNGKPVDELSPGQRSSAMLPLIALSEVVPLIIDQPEDNLDNRMVGSTLTRILAELKQTRQIIVTTHNPNIVVGGDAEQVIVLEAEGGHRARVKDSGSVDAPRIVEAIVGIMEGGADAFRTRERRYAKFLKEA